MAAIGFTHGAKRCEARNCLVFALEFVNKDAPEAPRNS
jgi:hypothetical protein